MSWQDTICETFCHSHYTPGRDRLFSGEISSTSHGGARMACIQASPGHFMRDRHAIKRDNRDGFVLLVSLRGELHMVQNGRQLRARQGEALLYHHGTPFEIEFPQRYGAASLWVDPDVMLRHCPGIASDCTTVIRPDTTNGALVLSMVRELCVSSVSKDTTDASRLVSATLDVVSTLGAPPLEQEGRSNEALFARLSEFMTRNIDDPELNLDALVEATGVSERTLYRLCAERGTTPMRWVWERRLEVAHELLARARVRSVTEAAFAAGFKDSAHFSRAFSRRFGFAPITLLRRG